MIWCPVHGADHLLPAYAEQLKRGISASDDAALTIEQAHPYLRPLKRRPKRPPPTERPEWLPAADIASLSMSSDRGRSAHRPGRLGAFT